MNGITNTYYKKTYDQKENKWIQTIVSKQDEPVVYGVSGLYTERDKVLGHFRRYNSNTLKKKQINILK